MLDWAGLILMHYLRCVCLTNLKIGSTPVYTDELTYNPQPEHNEEEEEHSEDNQEVQPLEIDSTS